MNIETMIFAYLAVCVSMILFNIACIFVFERNDRKLKKKSCHFEEQIKEQFLRAADGKHVDEEHKKYLLKKMKRVSNLMAFDEMLERLQQEYPQDMQKYLSEIYQIFVSLITVYARKNELKAAYFPYFLKKYEIVKNTSISIINDTLLEMVKKPSLYSRENALKVLYSTGNVEYVIRAIRILDRSDAYHSSKLLTDGLLTFAGSHEKLGESIWGIFGEISVEMKVTLLNYMRFESDRYSERIFEVLKDETVDDEVRYACIRYFGKYHHEEAYSLLKEFAQSEKKRPWEYASIAATALSAYPCEETIGILKTCLCSRNWYVRLNASKSLEALGLGYIDLIDIFEGEDRYAREILRYRFDERKARKKEAAVL